MWWKPWVGQGHGGLWHQHPVALRRPSPPQDRRVPISNNNNNNHSFSLYCIHVLTLWKPQVQWTSPPNVAWDGPLACFGQRLIHWSVLYQTLPTRGPCPRPKVQRLTGGGPSTVPQCVLCVGVASKSTGGNAECYKKLLTRKDSNKVGT